MKISAIAAMLGLYLLCEYVLEVQVFVLFLFCANTVLVAPILIRTNLSSIRSVFR